MPGRREARGLQPSLGFEAGERADAPLAARHGARAPSTSSWGSGRRWGRMRCWGGRRRAGRCPRSSSGGRRAAARRRWRASSRARRRASSWRSPPSPRAWPNCAASSRRAQQRREAGVRTVLFIDEIHRFNKAQQDVILPYVENGTVTLIGATTENPSFEVVAPLLSRVRVVCGWRRWTRPTSPASPSARWRTGSGGWARWGWPSRRRRGRRWWRARTADARAALSALEIAADAAREDGRERIGTGDVRRALQERRPYYDKEGRLPLRRHLRLHQVGAGVGPGRGGLLAGAHGGGGGGPAVHRAAHGDPGGGGRGAGGPRRRWAWPPPASRRCTSSACPRGSCRWRSARSTWRSRPRATRR